MADQINEGAYRISGRFGECFYIPPSRGHGQAMRLFEATQCEFTTEIAQEDVPLAGNRTGTKDGPEANTGTLVIQQIDAFFENLLEQIALSQSLEDRRRARDARLRIPRTFTLQVWQDDPEALGAIGWQLDGVRLSRLMGGFNFADVVTSREHPFRFERRRQIKGFERIGEQIDPVTGLPAIRYTSDLALP
jgi:hypothetical protein